MIPAVALAVDQREPNASPPADDDFAGAGLLNEGVEVVGAAVEAACGMGTEVK